MGIVMKKDNLFAGVLVIVCTAFPIATFSIYEYVNGVRFGYLAASFIPLIFIGTCMIWSAFSKEKS